jgi:hypothetical protein
VTKSHKNRRSISPIETGIEVVDDRSIMNLHEDPSIHQTSNHCTIIKNGAVTSIELNSNDERNSTCESCKSALII